MLKSEHFCVPGQNRLKARENYATPELRNDEAQQRPVIKELSSLSPYLVIWNFGYVEESTVLRGS